MLFVPTPPNWPKVFIVVAPPPEPIIKTTKTMEQCPQRFLESLLATELGHKIGFNQSFHRDFYSALFWCKVGSEQFLARYRGLIGCY